MGRNTKIDKYILSDLLITHEDIDKINDYVR